MEITLQNRQPEAKQATYNNIAFCTKFNEWI